MLRIVVLVLLLSSCFSYVWKVAPKEGEKEGIVDLFFQTQGTCLPLIPMIIDPFSYKINTNGSVSKFNSAFCMGLEIGITNEVEVVSVPTEKMHMIGIIGNCSSFSDDKTNEENLDTLHVAAEVFLTKIPLFSKNSLKIPMFLYPSVSFEMPEGFIMLINTQSSPTQFELVEFNDRNESSVALAYGTCELFEEYPSSKSPKSKSVKLMYTGNGIAPYATYNLFFYYMFMFIFYFFIPGLFCILVPCFCVNLFFWEGWYRSKLVPSYEKVPRCMFLMDCLSCCLTFFLGLPMSSITFHLEISSNLSLLFFSALVAVNVIDPWIFSVLSIFLLQVEILKTFRKVHLSMMYQENSVLGRFCHYSYALCHMVVFILPISQPITRTDQSLKSMFSAFVFLCTFLKFVSLLYNYWYCVCCICEPFRILKVSRILKYLLKGRYGERKQIGETPESYFELQQQWDDESDEEHEFDLLPPQKVEYEKEEEEEIDDLIFWYNLLFVHDDEENNKKRKDVVRKKVIKRSTVRSCLWSLVMRMKYCCNPCSPFFCLNAVCVFIPVLGFSLALALGSSNGDNLTLIIFTIVMTGFSISFFGEVLGEFTFVTQVTFSGVLQIAYVLVVSIALTSNCISDLYIEYYYGIGLDKYTLDEGGVGLSLFHRSSTRGNIICLYIFIFFLYEVFMMASGVCCLYDRLFQPRLKSSLEWGFGVDEASRIKGKSASVSVN